MPWVLYTTACMCVWAHAYPAVVIGSPRLGLTLLVECVVRPENAQTRLVPQVASWMQAAAAANRIRSQRIFQVVGNW